MKLHLPLFLRKSLLVCLFAVAACTVGSASAWAESQNLTFGDSSLTWDAQGDSFVNEAGEAAAFAEGDNVSFTGESIVTLGQDITAGTLDIAAGADVTIDLGNYTLNADTISLSGTLNVGDSLSIASGSTLAVQNDAAVLDSALVLGEKSGLAVDAAASLNNNTLTLQGGSNLILTAAGDGKTYTLFTGVSGLVDAEGNAITLDSTNNAIANYFDTTRPGTGFWAGASLVLNDGALQLVRHNETVKEAVTITTRRTSGADYQYYAGVTFENIEYAAVDSDACGGAIDGSSIMLNNNGSVTFSGNTTSSSASYSPVYGGAIYGDAGSTIALSNNGSVTFSGNTASSTSSSSPVYGGAIYVDAGSTITLDNNGSVTFRGNSATSSAALAYGGAIYVDDGSTITLSNNGSVTFSGNSVSHSYATGGAIYVDDESTIMLSNNGSVTFSENMVSGSTTRGGAIYGDDSTIALSNNGSVTFSENTASSSGGAIYGDSNSPIKLSSNDSVTFRGNKVSATSSYDSLSGGAIYSAYTLSICNNDSVLFEKNAEVSNGTYRLRSIYADGGSDTVTSLSAAAGKSIEFRDSVYVASGRAVNLNADYTYVDSEGVSVTIKQQGDILFTGKYTETHLNELLASAEAGRTATAEEILNSRTTEVNELTNLHGGRLRVEDDAIYQGQGIMVHEGSGATVRVKDATLSHSGYDLTFNAGTALEVAGNSTIRGNVNLKEGSLFKLEQAASLSLHETVEADAATLTVNGGALLEGGASLNASLTLADGATLDMDALEAGAVTLNGALTFGGQVTMGDKLLGILSEMSGWEESVTLFTGLTDLVLPAVAADDAADRLWVGDVFSNLAGNENYYFNYVPEVGSLAVVHVPEPTTTTLGLLALSALAVRRRRK